MATINLGRIKPVFRGAYSGATAYVVDDIVTHGDESFICIQAHGAGTQATSVTAYWTKLAAKGTDGTDVGTTITTQGDILYRDGSGLQRLAKGTASQVLTMNSGATAPEWAVAASADYARQIKYFQTSTTYSMASTSYADTGMSLTFDSNLASTNSIVKITISYMFGSNSNDNRGIGEYRDAGGSKITDVIGNPNYHWGSSTVSSSGHWEHATNICFATVSSTTPIAYRPYWKRQQGSANIWLGRSNDDSSTYPTMFMIEEYAE